MPVKVLDIDLYRASGDIMVQGPYHSAAALIRWRGVPIGQLKLPVSNQRVSLTSIQEGARKAFGRLLASRVVEAILFGEEAGAANAKAHSCACSVIVCTRDRPDDLKRCLEALLLSEPPPAEIIVVDNAPPDGATARVAAGYPVRYVVEPRKGLNWARTCGARAATSDLLLYTDDDVAVDSGWVGAMCEPFVDPQVGAVTGLVLALEMETPTQEAFERYIGFSRGFREQRFTTGNMSPVAAGNVGAGASMALRKDLVKGLKLFESELDCGTAACSGGDAYAFYRILKNGFAIVYTPTAVCWHRHRRTERELLTTLYGYSVGVYSVLFRCIADDDDWTALRAGLGWFANHHVRNAIRGLLRRPDAIPLRYTASEIRGVLAAFSAYRKTRRIERESARAYAVDKELA
jgi:GT2 family glycosyltransferase